MKAMMRILLRPLLPLLVALAALALPARGQEFFPDGTDYVHYVPNVPRTPNGRLYVGELTGDAKCHYRLDLPSGKSVTQVKLGFSGFDANRRPAVFVTRIGGKIDVYVDRDFKRVNAQGQPCTEAARVASAAPVAAAAEAPITIPVSNTADSFATTCDGRYAVVVGHLEDGSTPVPVSLVDLAAGREVDTLDFPSVGKFVAACDDGESVLVLMVAPQTGDTSVRRLTIAEPGELTDTGEKLDVPGTEPDQIFLKVYAVPGSKVGVALGLRTPGITFSIPGLQVLDTFPASFSIDSSAAVSCAGDKIYLRTNFFVGGDARGQINGFTLDPVTGALGDTPFLTIDVAYTPQASTIFGDGLAISRDGTRLIVPEASNIGSTSPPTPRVSFFDTTTGERVGFFDAFGAEGAYPTLVATYSCCAGTGLRLGIQRLVSGLIQITATGEIGKKYELQKSQNLVAWDKLLEFQMTASPTPYTDPDSQTNSTRFYRLKLIP